MQYPLPHEPEFVYIICTTNTMNQKKSDKREKKVVERSLTVKEDKESFKNINDVKKIIEHPNEG